MKYSGDREHEASTNASSMEGKMYAALPFQAEELLPMIEPMTPSSQWSNVTLHQGPPSEDPFDEAEKRFESMEIDELS